jgi:hypothetical protein
MEVFFAVLVVVELDAISIRETVKKRSGNSTKGSASEKERKKVRKKRYVCECRSRLGESNPVWLGQRRRDSTYCVRVQTQVESYVLGYIVAPPSLYRPPPPTSLTSRFLFDRLANDVWCRERERDQRETYNIIRPSDFVTSSCSRHGTYST